MQICTEIAYLHKYVILLPLITQIIRNDIIFVNM